MAAADAGDNVACNVVVSLPRFVPNTMPTLLVGGRRVGGQKGRAEVVALGGFNGGFKSIFGGAAGGANVAKLLTVGVAVAGVDGVAGAVAAASVAPPTVKLFKLTPFFS